MTKIETSLEPPVVAVPEQMDQAATSPLGSRIELGELAVDMAVAAHADVYSLPIAESGLSIATKVEKHPETLDITGAIWNVTDENPYVHMKLLNKERGPIRVVRAGIHVLMGKQACRGGSDYAARPKKVPEHVVDTHFYLLD